VQIRERGRESRRSIGDKLPPINNPSLTYPRQESRIDKTKKKLSKDKKKRIQEKSHGLKGSSSLEISPQFSSRSFAHFSYMKEIGKRTKAVWRKGKIWVLETHTSEIEDPGRRPKQARKRPREKRSLAVGCLSEPSSKKKRVPHRVWLGTAKGVSPGTRGGGGGQARKE